MPDFLKDILDHIGDPKTWIGAIFYAFIFLAFAVAAARVIRVAADRLMARGDDRLIDRTVVQFLRQLVQILVYVLALIFYFHLIPALNKLGTALLTGVSVSAVIFGLAAQNTLGNLVAGVTLLLYRPFHLDDLIQIATPTGTEQGLVERLTLGYTMLRTLDDRLVIVPNSVMASQVSLNLNRGALHAMAVVPVGVLDNKHVHEVRMALLELARRNPKIHRIQGCVTRSWEHGAILSLRVWCANPTAAAEVKRDISEAVIQRFSSEQVTLLVPSLPPPPAKAA